MIEVNSQNATRFRELVESALPINNPNPTPTTEMAAIIMIIQRTIFIYKYIISKG